MFSHVMVGVNDLGPRSVFTMRCWGPSGSRRGCSTTAAATFTGARVGFGITKPINGEPATHGNGATIGFNTTSPGAGGCIPRGRRCQWRHHL